MTKRAYRTGSVWQRHEARYGCPPSVDGERPVHTCSAPWVGTVEAGWTKRGGRRRRTVVAPTKAGAQRRVREALAEAEAAQAPQRGGKPTVKVWADRWLSDQELRVRPSTWQSNRSQIATWIVPTIGHRRLEQLGPADLAALERAMSHAGSAPSSILRARTVLGRMLKDASLAGHPIAPAVFAVDKPSKGETDRDVIPLPEALALLEAAAQLPDASRWVAALLQGMRPAECLGLTWQAVDFDSGLIEVSWQLKALPYRVPRDRSSGFRVPIGFTARQVDGALHLVRPKTNKGWRMIPLVPWMRSSLLAWQEVCPPSRMGFVWPDADGRPRRDDADRAAFVRLQDAAQVARVDGTVGRRFTLYEARHTAATLLRRLGVDDETIAAIMGHASILSTKAYLHTDTARTLAALEQAAERLGLLAPRQS